MPSDRDLVAMLGETWTAIASVCAGLTEDQWSTPTDCPGWSVKDQVAHVTGTESFLAGHPLPDHIPADLSHVRNELGHMNEVQVDYRRSWSGAEVLDEFRAVTDERLTTLRSWTAEDFDRPSVTPVGPGTNRDLLGFRAFDCWVHEQDIRRALGRPGGLDGRVARFGFERAAGTMPYVIGKKVAPPDGMTFVFAIGEPGEAFAVTVDGRRGRAVDTVPDRSDVTLAMDLETFICLACGRRTPDDTGDRVVIEGDERLARRLLSEMNYMI